MPKRTSATFTATDLEPDHRGPGRPRDESADGAILRAAVSLLQEGGAENLTVSAVVARSGVARATVYRRFPSRELLLAGAIHAVKGRAPYPVSGNVETDLGRAVAQVRLVFGEPQFRAVLPALVHDLLLDDAAHGVSETWNRIAPNHRRFADEYAENAAADGLRTDVDGYASANIIFGALLAALLSTGRQPTRAMADAVVSVVLNGLRPR